MGITHNLFHPLSHPPLTPLSPLSHLPFTPIQPIYLIQSVISVLRWDVDAVTGAEGAEITFKRHVALTLTFVGLATCVAVGVSGVGGRGLHTQWCLLFGRDCNEHVNECVVAVGVN